MKFIFCGGLDAPDWILAEITVLSKLTLMQMKRLVTQVIRSIKDEELNYQSMAKIAEAAGFTASDLKAAFAGVDFIIRSASKYDCEPETLGAELQQLGIPVEIGGTLVKSYAKALDSIRDHLAATSLHLARLDDFQWRVDYLLTGSTMRDLNVPSVSMSLTSTSGEKVAFELTAQKFNVLYDELKTARALMERV
ncbi:COMM domain-containing protein 4 [Thecamonas trahens ATCC 50062]|uniref:COMM domain-containing protein 4 n=1 Tax=Thecamonas trahens ATCC 50062 TaxID=461836 RepID=A0A0L0DIU3_THETB|nr:COMM domain-containing protein 4 [Thecamonas trahens ATCC 50062]KNC52026.1 COMM domain-containing protein 4 [Thecamonas trahens ATCC 50062]|eukprot:XP_013755609.1 COMM domain-containing protein 4 [Thecamonas trahens ATCC 50062]